MIIEDDLDAYLHVRNFLLNQNQRSLNEKTEDCMYHSIGDDDASYVSKQKQLRCAVGCLINDENYSFDLENLSVFEAESVVNAIKLSNPEWNVTPVSIDMLQSLQHVHDAAEVYLWQDIFDTMTHDLEEDGIYIWSMNRTCQIVRDAELSQ